MTQLQLLLNLGYSVVGFGFGYLYAQIAGRRRNGKRDGS